MKAIRTRYLPASLKRGPRISATDSDGNRVIIPHPDKDQTEENHFEACKALASKMKWNGEVTAAWFAGDCFWAWHSTGAANVYLIAP